MDDRRTGATLHAVAKVWLDGRKTPEAAPGARRERSAMSTVYGIDFSGGREAGRKIWVARGTTTRVSAAQT